MEAETESTGVPRERDDESGQFVESYPPEEFIRVIKEHDGMASTPEIYNELGCSNRLALNRLREMQQEGKVSARKVGNAYLWMVEIE